MRRSLLVIALLAVGCGGVDQNIEDQITIEQGVYGLLIAGCDTSGCVDQPAANAEVVVFVPGQGEKSVTSDDDGVYQIDLAAGDYTLCTYSCTPVTVPQGKIRYDWVSGPGGGHWEPHTP
jgi:hypothetical protein